MHNFHIIPDSSNKFKEDIIQNLLGGVYCSLVGPRYTGKTYLVHSVVNAITKETPFHERYAVVHLDMKRNATASKYALYRFIASNVSSALETRLHESLVDLPPDEISSSSEFIYFISKSVEASDKTLILVFDHVESVPLYVTKALLECLHAFYSQRSTTKHFRRISALVVGTFPLISCTADQTSPFISNRFVLDYLSADELKRQLSELTYDSAPLFNGESVALIATETDGHILAAEKVCVLALRHARKLKAAPIDANSVLKHLSSVELSLSSMDGDFAISVNDLLSSAEESKIILTLLQNKQVKQIGLRMDTWLELSGILVCDKRTSTYRWQSPLIRRALTNVITPLSLALRVPLIEYWPFVMSYAERRYASGKSSIEERLNFLMATLSHVRRAKTTEILSDLVRDSLRAAGLSSRISVVMLGENVNNISYVATSTNGNTGGMAPGRVEPNTYVSHLALSQALQVNRPYYHGIDSKVTVTLPLSYQGRKFGVVHLQGIFEDDQMYHNRPLITSLVQYCNAVARSISDLTEAQAARSDEFKTLELKFQMTLEQKDSVIRELKIRTIVERHATESLTKSLRFHRTLNLFLLAAFLITNVASLYRMVTNSVISTSWSSNLPSNAVLGFLVFVTNSLLVLSISITGVIIGGRKLRNGLLTQVLAALAITVPVLAITITPNYLSQLLSSVIFLVILVISQAVLAYYLRSLCGSVETLSGQGAEVHETPK